ncbi:MAG: Uma2 family endonuclease [Verrucomicrobiales bacterium]|nr:Uma2 family endonuclease [Verrucomicrobiales bacterium]
MSEAKEFALYTVEEYLEAEASSEVKHEYLGGTVHAMAGASMRHIRLVRRIDDLLNARFENGPCEAWSSDLKVWIKTVLSEFFYYPDVVVGCDPTDENDQFLKNPTIIFEVLSPSSEQIDRREKMFAYQTIASLEHYVIVSQEERRVEWLRREGNAWVASVLTDTEDLLDFPGQGASLTLGEIYEGITFE